VILDCPAGRENDKITDGDTNLSRFAGEDSKDRRILREVNDTFRSGKGKKEGKKEERKKKEIGTAWSKAVALMTMNRERSYL